MNMTFSLDAPFLMYVSSLENKQVYHTPAFPSILPEAYSQYEG
jgi:hypothetical protein